MVSPAIFCDELITLAACAPFSLRFWVSQNIHFSPRLNQVENGDGQTLLLLHAKIERPTLTLKLYPLAGMNEVTMLREVKKTHPGVLSYVK